MRSEYTHSEAWQVTIVREDHDQDWPDELSLVGVKQRRIRPDAIVFDLRSGEPEPVSVQISGVRCDQAAPDFAGCNYVPGENVPEWADTIIEHERQKLRLGRGRVAPSHG